MRPNPSLVRAVPVLVLLAACGDQPEPALRVGEVGFAEEEVAALSPEAREQLVAITALGAAVAENRVDSLVAPLVEREVERARLVSLPYHLGAAASGVGEEELRAAYAASPELELSVRHVVRLVPGYASADRRAEARATAAEVERRARAGEDFAALAGEFSEEPGAAERGGLLQPGREGTWVGPFWEAARALQPGEVSGVVETEYGYHVLRLDERRVLPFEEAARLPLLRALVPAPRAISAMEEWIAARPPVVLDPPALLEARRALGEGVLPDSTPLATSPEGGVYTGRDLAASWAALDPGERQTLSAADDAAFGQWVENDAREALWADQARRLDADPPADARAQATARWGQRVAQWAAAFGFEPRMSAEAVRAAALRGLSSGAQEARIARQEMAGLVPFLRAFYTVSGSAASPAAESSSAMRNSESSR